MGMEGEKSIKGNGGACGDCGKQNLEEDFGFGRKLPQIEGKRERTSQERGVGKECFGQTSFWFFLSSSILAIPKLLNFTFPSFSKQCPSTFSSSLLYSSSAIHPNYSQVRVYPNPTQLRSVLKPSCLTLHRRPQFLPSRSSRMSPVAHWIYRRSSTAALNQLVGPMAIRVKCTRPVVAPF